MSDALALLKDETEDVLFLTGLANVQSLRTARGFGFRYSDFGERKTIGSTDDRNSERFTH